MVKSFGILSAFVVVFFISIASAQIVDVTVEISIDRMPETERNDLKKLEQLIPPYFENYEWIENTLGIEVPLKISIFPQSVNASGFERIFTAQMFISNAAGDQRFFEKNFNFVYNTNSPLIHADMIHSLSGTFDFYAYLFLAGELDTYEPLGGSSVYERARDIATRGQISERPAGWKQRIQDLDEILRLRDYRMAKYYYWSAVDLLYQKKNKAVPGAIDNMLEHIAKMFEQNARERYTHIFLDVHARDIAEIIRDLGTPKQSDKIMALDPDNEEIYINILQK
ncbi:MAG TPA: hypothetical protein DHW42_08155 [Candidatus Marinimicrobia bacterium]|nr:hypothetical protein [Candidatus Neomarinimicrobiota bacterium]